MVVMVIGITKGISEAYMVLGRSGRHTHGRNGVLRGIKRSQHQFKELLVDWR